MEKVIPPLYQHPFVDVFHKFKLFEASQITKEGDVTQSIDKKLGKKVYKIQGSTSASNYIMTPCKKAKYKSLGLTGKYNYLIMKTQVGKLFSTHLDFIVNDKNLCRISISNIFKETKVTGSSIQIPIKELEPQKWTVVQLNVFNILDENNMFSKSSEEKRFYLRSFQVCSNQFIRGLATSDIEYNVTTFPKELALKCKRGEDWFKDYNWITIGNTDEPGEADPDLKPKKETQKQRPKSALRKTNPKAKTQPATKDTKKKVVFTLDQNEIRRDIQFEDDIENNKNYENTKYQEEYKSLADYNKEQETQDQKEIEEELYRVRDNTGLIERTRQEIDDIKKQYDIELYGKDSSGKDYEVKNNEKLLIKQQPEPEGSVDPNDVFVLKPDPIMRLNQCIGMHPRFTSRSILFHKHPKYNSEVLYGTANMIVSMNTKSLKQKFLFDHSDHVKKIAMTPEFIVSASKPGDGKQDKAKKRKFNKLVEEQEVQVIVWDVHTGANIVSFKPPLQEICDLFVTFKNMYLVLVGKDYQGRDLILVYNFPDMVKYQKVDLVTRQLSDFTIYSVAQNPINDNMFITAGKENIRFWKIKNTVAGTNIVLNKIGRGKEFTAILYDYEYYGDEEGNPPRNRDGSKAPIGKILWIYVATACGHLFQINYTKREIEQVIKIHEDAITALQMTNDRRYAISSSLDGNIRFFTNDFSQCVSELKTNLPIIDISLNIYSSKLSSLTATGSISIYDIEEQQYSTIMRSHTDNCNSIDYMNKTDTLVTACSAECSVKIWDQNTKAQLYEFITDNDYPEVVCSHPGEPYFAVGYKSGFVRVFDSVLSKVIHETMVFESGIKDLRFSGDGRHLASISENSRIVIHDVEKDFVPIKTIDYDFPNNNYFSLDFSSEGNLMANISTNANTITVWETINFTLRYEIDLTGNLLYKLRFAPNGKDLVVLTTTSKLKFFRIGVGEISEYKNIPGVHDHACIDFEISPNNKYIATCGKDGLVKIFDYFMRGNKVIPASQAFIGHYTYPFKLIWGGSARGDKIFTISEYNGIFEWQFHAENAAHMNNREITKHYENIQGENYRVDKGGVTLKKSHCRPSEILRSMKLKGQGLKEATKTANLRQTVNTGAHHLGQIDDEDEEEPHELDLNPYTLPKTGEATQGGDTYSYKDSHYLAQQNHDRVYPTRTDQPYDTFTREDAYESHPKFKKDLYEYYSKENPEKSLDPIVQSNLMNYKYEAIDINMAHTLSYSCSYRQKRNLVWNQEERWIGYTFESIVIIERLDEEKTQKFLKEGNDVISDLKLSPSGKFLMAYTHNATVDGLPMIYIWDATTFKKIAQISINQRVIVTADFSPNSNMILVVSFDDTDEENPNSIVAIWDFLDGKCETLCRAHIPAEIKGAAWNYFLKNLEFATWNNTQYCFWKVTDELSLQYQDGTTEFEMRDEETSRFEKPPQAVLLGKDDDQAKISTIQFAYPVKNLQTVFLLIGLSNGYVWSVDSRTNSLLSQVKISDTAITNIEAKQRHIVVSKEKENSLSCWQIPKDEEMASKGNNLFANPELTLLLDGETKCMYLNELTAEGFVTTFSGTIWFVDWDMETTLKINSFHTNTSSLCKFGFKYVSPNEFEISEKKGEELGYEFDKNYYVMSSSSDGVLKLWNMHTSEQMMQFVVPKEK